MGGLCCKCCSPACDKFRVIGLPCGCTRDTVEVNGEDYIRGLIYDKMRIIVPEFESLMCKPENIDEAVRKVNLDRVDTRRGPSSGQTVLHICAKRGYATKLIGPIIRQGCIIPPDVQWVRPKRSRWTGKRKGHGHSEVTQRRNEIHDIQRTTDGDTAAHDAAFYGCLENLKALKACGADMMIANDVGNHPVDKAIAGGYLKVAEYLKTLYPPDSEAVKRVESKSDPYIAWWRRVKFAKARSELCRNQVNAGTTNRIYPEYLKQYEAKLAEHLANEVKPTREDVSVKYGVGDHVFVFCNPKSFPEEWYDVTIAAVLSNGKYRVKWDDSKWNENFLAEVMEQNIKTAAELRLQVRAEDRTDAVEAGNTAPTGGSTLAVAPTEDPRTWTPAQTAQWIRSLGKRPATCATAFEEYGITGSMLVDGDITDETLKDDLGVSSGLLRKVILDNIDEQLKAETSQVAIEIGQLPDYNTATLN